MDDLLDWQSSMGQGMDSMFHPLDELLHFVEPLSKDLQQCDEQQNSLALEETLFAQPLDLQVKLGDNDSDVVVVVFYTWDLMICGLAKSHSHLHLGSVLLVGGTAREDCSVKGVCYYDRMHHQKNPKDCTVEQGRVVVHNQVARNQTSPIPGQHRKEEGGGHEVDSLLLNDESHQDKSDFLEIHSDQEQGGKANPGRQLDRVPVLLEPLPLLLRLSLVALVSLLSL